MRGPCDAWQYTGPARPAWHKPRIRDGLPQHRRCAIHRRCGAVSPRTTATIQTGHTPHTHRTDAVQIPLHMCVPSVSTKYQAASGSWSGTPKLRATLVAPRQLPQGLLTSQRIIRSGDCVFQTRPGTAGQRAVTSTEHGVGLLQ
jgi:hypothetical protein